MKEGVSDIPKYKVQKLPKIHELKTWPEYYKEVDSGIKTFEIRKNDRNFKVGDWLLLKEYDPETNTYTGRERMFIVSYLLDKQPFVPVGYVCMAIVHF